MDTKVSSQQPAFIFDNRLSKTASTPSIAWSISISEVLRLSRKSSADSRVSYKKYLLNHQVVRRVLRLLSDSKVSSCSLPDQRPALTKVLGMSKHTEVIDISVI